MFFSRIWCASILDVPHGSTVRPLCRRAPRPLRADAAVVRASKQRNAAATFCWRWPGQTALARTAATARLRRLLCLPLQHRAAATDILPFVRCRHLKPLAGLLADLGLVSWVYARWALPRAAFGLQVDGRLVWTGACRLPVPAALLRAFTAAGTTAWRTGVCPAAAALRRRGRHARPTTLPFTHASPPPQFYPALYLHFYCSTFMTFIVPPPILYGGQVLYHFFACGLGGRLNVLLFWTGLERRCIAISKFCLTIPSTCSCCTVHTVFSPVLPSCPAAAFRAPYCWTACAALLSAIISSTI